MRLAFGVYAAAVVLAVMWVSVGQLGSSPSPSAPRVELVRRMPAYEPRPLTPVTSAYRVDGRHSGVSTSVVPLQLVATAVGAGNKGIHSAAKGSPAADASGFYVGTDDGHLYAFANDGHLRWQVKLANAGQGVHGTPMLDGERVYIGAYNGRLYAFDKNDGRPLWLAVLGDAIGASPTPDGDDLLISVETRAPNGYVARLSRADGHVVWLSDWLGEQSHASPTVAGDAIFLGANNQDFFALARSDGHLLWRTPVGGDVKGTACVIGDAVIAITNAGTAFALRRTDGGVLWRRELGSEGRGSVSCLEQSTGAPVSVGLVFVTLGTAAARGGFGTSYALDAATGEVRWSAPQGSPRPLMSPLVAPDPGGRLFAWFRCDDTALCAYDAWSGVRLSHVELGAPLSGSPVVYDGGLVVSLDHPGGIVRLVPQ
ncbi:MAG: PQQ-binding-like beta-propeller repeat protein [Myxococcota bacterium]